MEGSKVKGNPDMKVQRVGGLKGRGQESGRSSEWEVQGVEAEEGEGPVRSRAGAAACTAHGGVGAAFGGGQGWVIIKVMICHVRYY